MGTIQAGKNLSKLNEYLPDSISHTGSSRVSVPFDLQVLSNCLAEDSQGAVFE